jgi:glycosyltransferase involved in cell wall biosynthesis
MHPMKPHLFFVHQYFWPELAGSAQQLTDLVLGLREQGYSIEVVTAQPSYYSTGKLPAKENFKGIMIHRLPKIQLSRHQTIGRILSALSFFFAASFKIFFMDHRALLVLGSDPPCLSILGWFFNLIRRQRYILIVSDIYPDIAASLGHLNPRGVTVKVLDVLNRWAYGRAQRIVTLGEKMAERLMAKAPQKNGRSKVVVIHNWADGDLIQPVTKNENPFSIQHGLVNRLVLLFSGNLGKIYDFQTILKTAALVRQMPGIEFLFIGEGPLRRTLELEVSEKNLTNVRLLPYQPAAGLPYSLTCGDLAMIPLKNEAAGLCIPGKLYYALAGGLCLFVIAPDDSEPAQIVKKYDCGWLVPNGEAKYAADTLKQILQNPSLLEEKKRKARACFEAQFTRERALSQYASVFADAQKTL